MSTIFCCFSTHVVGEDDTKLPDLVLDVNRSYPAERRHPYCPAVTAELMTEDGGGAYQLNIEVSGSGFFPWVMALTSRDARSMPSSSAILSLP